MGGFRFLSIMILLGLAGGVAQAQSRVGSEPGSIIRKMMAGPNNGIHVPTTMGPYMRFGIPTNDTNAQRSTLEALVGSSVEPLSWPDLPRVWWRFEKYNGTTDVTYGGFQWSQNKITGSTRHGLVYKYNRSTSFVLIGSLRAKNAPKAEETGIDANGSIDMQHLVYEDPVSGMMYPNVRKGYPMVGMCMYDMSMATENTHSYSFDILGNGKSRENLTGFATPFTLFSNFFQLDPEQPIISYYVMERCQKMFESAMKKWVEEQFTRAHRAYRTETMSECKRERGGTDRTTVGDKGCFKWHSELPESVQKVTVPRCERGADDLFRCALKSGAEGATCPMKQGNDAKIVPDTQVGAMRIPSAPCDMGLTCVPSLPAENIRNLESNRLFLSADQLRQLGVCRKPRTYGGPK